MKQVENGGPKPIARLTETELRNVLEQQRLVSDATKVQMMLASALEGTMARLAEKRGLPKLFELNVETGEVFEKEPHDG